MDLKVIKKESGDFGVGVKLGYGVSMPKIGSVGGSWSVEKANEIQE